MIKIINKLLHCPLAIVVVLLSLSVIVPVVMLAQDNSKPAAPVGQPSSTVEQTTTVGSGENLEQQQTITVEEFVRLLEKEAENKNPKATLLLGTLYERGLGYPPRNYGKAFEYYKKAADLDWPEAFFNLGVCYEIGIGITPDFKKALENYLTASKKGLPMADFKLASLYINGLEVPQDTELGLKYLTAAADKGLTAAIKEVGALYYYGRLGKPKDLTKALEVFRQAAEAGDAEAMKNVGIMYKSGEGSAVNLVEGLKWYLLASQFGYQNEDMTTIIAEIKTSLKADEVAKAENEAKIWTEQFTAAQEAKAKAAQEAETATKPPAPAPKK
jgi:TPR repeat protein